MRKRILTATLSQLICGISSLVATQAIAVVPNDTIWPGNFSIVSVNRTSTRISVNYPRRGVGKICGIELKARTKILNRRVWENIVSELDFKVEYNDVEHEISPTIKNADGPQLYFLFHDAEYDYASLIISTRDDKETLAEYFRRMTGSNNEEIIAVTKECTTNTPFAEQKVH